MAKKLQYKSDIEQGKIVESWHVSQSVDAFASTNQVAYDISVSGSFKVTGSQFIEPTNLNNQVRSFVLSYDNTTGQIFKMLTTAIESTFPFVFNTTSLTGIQSAANTASGANSIAMGINTTATGGGSTAMGTETTASGDASTAMGEGTKALGDSSLAIGDTTIAGGSNSTAMGINTIASGDTSVAMGSGTTASGIASTAMGVTTIAGGSNSTAMGSGTTASGTNSVAMGNTTTAVGANSVAMGSNTKASGVASTAMGVLTSASADFSTAMGIGTEASGNNSTAMGDNTEASGYASTAMGRSTTASGSDSTAMGFFTEASGLRSTSMGIGTDASGNNSTAMGDNTEAFGYASTAIGRFNVLNTGDNKTFYAATNTAFSIGNGTAGVSRSDAFKVLFNGTTTISGSITGTSIIKSGGTSTEYLMADGSVTTASYKVYTALLTQTGTSTPVATILENTTGGTITWSRTSVGVFVATISGAVFTVDKTIVFNNNGTGGASFTPTIMFSWIRTSDTQMTLYGANGDNKLTSASFEIRVYS